MKAEDVNKTIPTKALWLINADRPQFPKLESDLTFDVCVVGAGISGLTTAYLLSKIGKKVCVIDSQEVGAGQTGYTTAHFTYVLDDRFFNLKKYHGLKGARLALNSHKAALRKLKEIVETENIDCDLQYVDGHLFLSTEHDLNFLKKELAVLKEIGADDVFITEQLPFDTLGKNEALCFPSQIQFHPLKYLFSLARIISQNGGQIFTNSKVVKVVGGEDAYIKTEAGHTVSARSIVVATNSPVNNLFTIHSKQAPYRTYVVAFRMKKNAFPKGLYWDTHDPYHYVRTVAAEEGDFLIVGGEDHKTGQESDYDERYKNLIKWAQLHFPQIEDVSYKWSGQVMEPVDGLAYLGHNPLDKKNVYVITGDSGNGLTHATIGAMIICDQIQAINNPWSQLYNPARTPLRSFSEYVRENLNVAKQYLDWLTPESRSKIEKDLHNNEGTVVNLGTKKVAVFKDDEGQLNACSAICTHLGCVVKWNSSEKTWDCPCHGSRFDPHGKVIEGPASKDLKSITLLSDTGHIHKKPIERTRDLFK